MQFNSVAFVFFFLPLVILVFRFLNGKLFKRIWLILASVFFTSLLRNMGSNF